ncbi:hypothetical protein Vadar_009193 [Vaccinium darrowii]|uniref:Uncharacterized protein n=1 Tax=Vaccinium darrowii TaxID=229202 RepID=A0ACB7Y5Z7_9ERIC|nr:hypothetical protein Vadar_009193 [Vaccinium darrowii]
MEFCTRIANQLMLNGIQNGLSKNIVSSPLSINTVLNMATAGSKGRTLKRLLGLLGSKNVDEINAKSRKMMAVTEGGGSSKDVSNGPILTMVNGAWVDQGFPLVDKYKEHILKGIFKGEANNVDFKAKANEVVDEINSWANTASRGLIKKLLQHESISRDTILILANGLYFKGIWDPDYNFDAEMTRNRKFYLLNGSVVSVPFMTSKEKENYYYKEFDGFKVLKIPYQSHQANNFSMYFFLPDELDGLQNLLGKFNSNSEFLNEKYFKLAKEELDEFWIPKFKFSFDFDVLEVLDDMGEPLSFIGNVRDLSEMMHISEDAPYSISKMVQKAYIEVDEKGTEAVAITANNFSLYFFLPDERDGLQDLLVKFDSNSGFLNQECFELKEMNLSECWIPKFKFSFGFDVLKVMDDMGKSLSLNPGDLSEMIHNSRDAPIFISKMFQKAYIEVNEKGTAATAITGIAYRLLCARISPKISFIADHPFVFIIGEEDSGLVLFTRHL